MHISATKAPRHGRNAWEAGRISLSALLPVLRMSLSEHLPVLKMSLSALLPVPKRPCLVLMAALLLLSACSGGSNKASALLPGGNAQADNTPSCSAQADTLPLRYAENLSIIDYAGYSLVRLRNPWDTAKLLHTYILVDKALPLPDGLPAGATVVRTPLDRALVYSAVHCSLLKELGALGSISGVCDLKYIRMPEIAEGHRNGTIADAGSSMDPDIERIIDLHPDAILLSPFENSGGYGRVEKLNIPLIECADYMETSPLGRAEWMRFYGRLFGKQQQADSLFASVEQSYIALKEAAATLRESAVSPGKATVSPQKPTATPQPAPPTVMCDLKTSSTWYTPGGNSTIARLYADACADYIFREDTHSGSLAYSFEAIFERGQQADFWLIRYNQPTDKTYSELKEEFAPYAGFRAFKERNIYGCNTGRVAFYEETPFHPDWFLKDLIKIFHSSMLEGYELKYYSKLAE